MSSQKSPEKHIHFEEEQDFFLAFLEKKLKNKSASKENKDFYDKCKEIYLEAEKQHSQDQSSKSKKEAHSKLLLKEHDKEVRFKTICDLVNLIFFCNHFGDASKRNDFKDNFEEIKSNLHLESYPDFDIFAEFYQKVFNFSAKKEAIKHQIEKTLNEMEHYLNGSQNIALRQTSYHNLLHTVDKTMNSEYFGGKKSERRPSMSINLNNSGKKLAQAMIDKPFHGEEENTNEDLKKEHHKISTKSPAFKPTKSSTLPEELSLNNNDGFIEVKPKYSLIKKSKHQEEEDQKTNQKNFKKSKGTYNRREENSDDVKGKGDWGNRRYVQKKVYAKKEEH